MVNDYGKITIISLAEILITQVLWLGVLGARHPRDLVLKKGCGIELPPVANVLQGKDGMSKTW